MELPHQEQQTIPTKILVGILLGFIFIGIVVYFLIAMKKEKTSPQNTRTSIKKGSVYTVPTPTPTLLPYQTKGSMKLQTKGTDTSYSIGQPIEIMLIASSENEKIVGYDVVLSYDTTAFQKSEITNNDSTFKLFTYDRDGRVLVSAVKDLQYTATEAWENHPLFSYVFTPQKKGTYTFSLRPFGQETSKLVNEKAEPAYPYYQDLQLVIK